MSGDVAKIYGLTKTTVCNEKLYFAKQEKLYFATQKTVICETSKTEFGEMRKTVICEMILVRFISFCIISLTGISEILS